MVKCVEESKAIQDKLKATQEKVRVVTEKTVNHDAINNKEATKALPDDNKKEQKDFKEKEVKSVK